MSGPATGEPAAAMRFYNIALPVNARVSEADVKRAYEMNLPLRIVWETPLNLVLGNDGKTLLIRCSHGSSFSGIIVGARLLEGEDRHGIYAPVDPNSDAESSANSTADTLIMSDSDQMDVSSQVLTEASQAQVESAETQVKVTDHGKDDPGDPKSPSILQKQ